MGVHEHWNNATDKQYSRNLGAEEGIELIQSIAVDPLTGDFEPDGDINEEDFSVVVAYWQAQDCPGCLADLDGDGTVRLSDLTIWMDSWERTTAQP